MRRSVMFSSPISILYLALCQDFDLSGVSVPPGVNFSFGEIWSSSMSTGYGK